MGTLGTYLKNAREARGFDLREAAQQTRISHTYLTAIEREDFSKLPGEVFVKGFLRNYARFLRIPEDEVMKLYAELKAPVPAPAAAADASRPERPKQGHREPDAVPAEERGQAGTDGIERYVWAGVALVAIVAILFIVLPARHGEKKHTEFLHSDVTGTGQLATASTATTGLEKLYLDVTALEDLWVLVRTDSSPQKKAVLKKGESVTWSADERFLLSIGNAESVKVLLNGKEVVINAPKNTPVRDIVITAKGLAAPKISAEQVRPRKPKPAVAQPPLTAPVPSEPGVPAEQPAPQAAPAPGPAAGEPVSPAPQPVP